MTRKIDSRGLTVEESALRDLARDFFANKVAPLVPQLERDPSELIRPLFAEMGQLDLLGPNFPEAHGGGGGRLRTRAIVSEEAARVNAGLDISMFADVALFARCIDRLGTDEQKRTYLEPVLRGDKIGAMAITEPTGGSDALSPRSRARRTGSGWVLDAAKTFITNAPIADFIVLIARTSGENRQLHGGTWFILERGMPGLVQGPAFRKAGWKSSPTGEVTASSVTLDDTHVLGEPEEGFRYLVDSLDNERVLIGASALGLAQACLELSVRYARERVVFGQAIAGYQLIQDKIATMSAGIELGRTLVYSLLDRIDRGEKVTHQAAVAKLHATELAVQSALDTIQILGGAAYVDDHPATRFLHDAKLHEIGGGTTEIMKIIIARESLRSA
ncbi:hypothetical protein BAY59_24485 [Prauserella coralliicola]|nr:hypothetical protein BAY59_24485 [Prauserella coralliicola]